MANRVQAAMGHEGRAPKYAKDEVVPERVESFQNIVKRSMPCFVRRPRGQDIYAACGQLKRTLEAA